MKKLLTCLLALSLLLTACGAPASTDSSASSSSSSSESTSSSESSREESKPVISVSSSESSSVAASSSSSTSSSASSSSESEPASEADDASASSSAPDDGDPESSEESVPEASSVASQPPAQESSQSRTPGLMLPPDEEQTPDEASPNEEIASSASFKAGNGTSDEIDVFDRINQVRENLGLRALSYHSSLQSAARIRAKEFAVYDLESHIRPDGRAWYTVLQADVPVSYRSAGENVAGLRTNRSGVTGVTPAEWVDMWIGSSDHYATMTDSGYTHMGVGIYTDHDADGTLRTYAVTLFASF